MIQARADIAKFNTAIDRAKTGLEYVALAEARRATELVVDYMGRYAPEDTAKFKRGVILAGRQIGVGTLPLPPITRSKWNAELMKVLVRQVEFLEERVTALRGALQNQLAIESRRKKRASRSGKSQKVQRLEAKIATAVDRVQRARMQVDKLKDNPFGTVIRRRVSYALAGNEDRDNQGYGIEVEVRDRVYGGAGRVYVTKREVRVLLQVLEPYALSVERRSGVRTRAMWWARSQVKFTGPKSTFR